MGTPAIAYNVNGLRDSVLDGETGLLTVENTPEYLAKTAISVLEDKDLLHTLSLRCLKYAAQFNWDITATRLDLIMGELLVRT